MTHPDRHDAAAAAASSSSFAHHASSDDSDDEDDLRSLVGGEEAYELRERDESWDATKDEGRALRTSTSDGGSVASFQLYTPDEDRAVRRKFDRKLVLFVALLFLLSFLDRSSTSTSSIPS